MTSRYIVAGLFLLLLVPAATQPVSTSDIEQKRDTDVAPDEIPELTEFASLQEIFNEDKDHVRLVALLSPSCGYCIKGYRYMRKILDEVQDERLKMYVIWEPMLSGDSRELSQRMSRKAEDARMVYQAWDAERITGRAWQNVLNLNSVAWDVYFLYDGSAEWPDDGPTEPVYWQHQGQSETADRLDYDLLKTKIEELLAQKS